MRRQHVYFIDQIDLEATSRRRVLHVIQQLTSIVHLGARRRIDLDQVDETALVDFRAGTAFAARTGRDPGVAVERFGQDSRYRGFTYAPGTGEKIGVVKALIVERVYQRATDMFLTDHVVERSGAPFSGENEITH
jgi:hypothetical protein